RTKRRFFHRFTFFSETLAVRYINFHQGETQVRYEFAVQIIEFRFFTSVHLVPKQVDTFNSASPVFHYNISKSLCKAQCTFHDNPVSRDRRQNVVHSHKGMKYSGRVDRSGQVEENYIKRNS